MELVALGFGCRAVWWAFLWGGSVFLGDVAAVVVATVALLVVAVWAAVVPPQPANAAAAAMLIGSARFTDSDLGSANSPSRRG